MEKIGGAIAVIRLEISGWIVVPGANVKSDNREYEEKRMSLTTVKLKTLCSSEVVSEVNMVRVAISLVELAIASYVTLFSLSRYVMLIVIGGYYCVGRVGWCKGENYTAWLCRSCFFMGRRRKCRSMVGFRVSDVMG